MCKDIKRYRQNYEWAFRSLCNMLVFILQRWELLVLSKLKWDVASVTPQDFLRHLLGRLPVQSVGIEYNMVNSHAKTLIALCARGMY